MEYELALEMIEQYRQENMELRELITEIHKWNLRSSIAWLKGDKSIALSGMYPKLMEEIKRYSYLEDCANCGQPTLDGHCRWCNDAPDEPDGWLA